MSDLMPAWSPDGARIAFTRTASTSNPPTPGSDARVWVLDAAGGRQQSVGRGSRPQWSPDGRRLVVEVAVSGYARTELWIVNADGSGRRRLAAANSGAASWSPDGKRVAFLEFYPMRWRGQIVWTSTLKVAASDGSSVQVLVDGRRGPLLTSDDPRFGELLGSPEWSPDGQAIAVTTSAFGPNYDEPPAVYYMVTRAGIGLVSLDGNARTLVEAEVAHMGSGFPAIGLAWSPDGRYIAFLPDGYGGGARVVPASGGQPRRILPSPDGYYAGLTWAPDSKTLAVSQCSSPEMGPDHCRLVLVHRDGTERRQVTTGARTELEPAWRPNGGVVPQVAPPVRQQRQSSR